MDKGANFYNCDFQVHTPRDINWEGDGAVTDEERKTYAEEFIQACRQKGLNAVAITDHHDFAFFPYIKKATQDELDDNGNPIDENQRVVVFPGLELTLENPPCQALLILDSDFPVNLLNSILTMFSISPAPPEDGKHAEVQRIPEVVVDGLAGIYSKLDSHEQTKGRYIVLPNVSESGSAHTILRKGFAGFYKAMPCVGGYVDGSLTQLGTGRLDIVKGKVREYGFKKLAVIQTSDNRTRTFSELGSFTTWIKWSEPTAEAIRQACLAEESRLSQNEPSLPSVWITSIEVTNSKFFGPINVDFNRQYNAIIGGRGTGKSTILEYLRWGLCDQSLDFSDDEDILSLEAKRKNLIEKTLKRFDGEVRISFLLNEIPHIVRRNSTTHEIFLKIGHEDFVQCREEDIRNILPVQAYSQKQLSNVGVRIDELKRFVELPIKQNLNQIRAKLQELEVNIRNLYGQIVRRKNTERDIQNHQLEIASLNRQVQTLRANLTGLSKDEQTTIEQKAKYDKEESLISTWQDEVVLTRNRIGQLRQFVEDLPSTIQDTDEIINQDLLSRIQGSLDVNYKESRTIMDKLAGLFDEDGSTEINKQFGEWRALKAAYDLSYIEAKNKATSSQQQLTGIQRIEERLQELNGLLANKLKNLTELGNPEDAYQDAKSEWRALHESKLSLLINECQKFNTLSNGSIKAELSKSVSTQKVKRKLQECFSGMRIMESKIDKICEVVNSINAMDIWENVIAELERLALFVPDDEMHPDLPDTPILTECGIIDSEKERICQKFEIQKWLDLATLEIDFRPEFYYRMDQDLSEYINFADASAGQQATSLLTVLLNQEGPPLVIDQPEDDIDNRALKDIIEQIWESKKKRQIVFSSHNANLVVNGDSELVVCCDYRKAGKQSGGQIKAQGAIDQTVIKNEITSVMEGGEKAFKLRKEKYGF